MHELSIMQNIFQIVEDTLIDHGFGQANLVKLKIGTLMGVEEEQLQFAFTVLKVNTPLENARLQIQYVPGEAYCAICDHRFMMDGYRVRCPLCGQAGRIIAGREMYVESLEVEEDERDKGRD